MAHLTIGRMRLSLRKDGKWWIVQYHCSFCGEESTSLTRRNLWKALMEFRPSMLAYNWDGLTGFRACSERARRRTRWWRRDSKDI